MQKEKGTTEDEMVRWHHQLNGHEFKQTPGDSGGQRSLMCFSPWGLQRVGHYLATEQQHGSTLLISLSNYKHLLLFILVCGSLH